MSTLSSCRQQCFYFILRQFTSKTSQIISITNIHTKARQSPYVGTKDIHRTNVPDEKVPWLFKWPDYKSTEYTAEKVLKNPPWADHSDARKIKHFNELDGNLNRTSFMGKYDIDKETNRPKNLQGRTGLSGRGLLGRWGPNHAGDSVITRWAKDQNDNKQKVLEIILITRKDSNALALPGGMIDPGEHTLTAIKREFIEEVMNSNSDSTKQIDKLFENAKTVYKGYIDDPRNTDNAWIETEAINAHDETGELTNNLKLEAGDDAATVDWVRLDRKISLHASHESIIRIAIRNLGAYEYWSDVQNKLKTNNMDKTAHRFHFIED